MQAAGAAGTVAAALVTEMVQCEVVRYGADGEQVGNSVRARRAVMPFNSAVAFFIDLTRPRPALILATHIDLCPEILSRQCSQMLLEMTLYVPEAFAPLAPTKGGSLAAAAFAERSVLGGLSGDRVYGGRVNAGSLHG